MLPYPTALERLAERHQTSADYLQSLNPGVGWPNPSPGMPLRVLAVRFETEVRVALPYRKSRRIAADSLAALRADSAIASLHSAWERRAPPDVDVRVSTRQNVVRVYQRGKLVARYPATVGSREFPNPQGEWRVASQVFAPHYRFDRSFLETGTRSERSVRVPPGPNNIVGLVWMGLDKPGFKPTPPGKPWPALRVQWPIHFCHLSGKSADREPCARRRSLRTGASDWQRAGNKSPSRLHRIEPRLPLTGPPAARSMALPSLRRHARPRPPDRRWRRPLGRSESSVSGSRTALAEGR